MYPAVSIKHLIKNKKKNRKLDYITQINRPSPTRRRGDVGSRGKVTGRGETPTRFPGSLSAA